MVLMINKNQLIRGSIWLIDLNPTKGREQSKIRPCLIISTNSFNFGPSDLVVILPITSTERKLWWFIEIEPNESGLTKKSYIICNQIRTISIERLKNNEPCGYLNQNTLYQVEERIKILLDL